jgi:AAA15 family ATPase/GTPase
MITRLELTNFTVFRNLAIDFSPRINIVIGENGTGKTHLLKAAYALCLGGKVFKEKPDTTRDELEVALTSKFVRLFMPLQDKLGKLRHHAVSGRPELKASFTLDRNIEATFHANSKTVAIQNDTNYAQYHDEPIFIPTKEVLSLINGISASNSDKKTIERIFDDTYLDLCQYLLRTTSINEQERLNFDPRFGAIFPEIVNAIHGKFEFSEGRIQFEEGSYQERRVKNQHAYGDKTETIFVPVKGSETSNSMTAEGFRKIGILQQLLVNQTLKPGVSGPLFWDEPECNMNPKLVRLLVEILLELSRSGQQIILATHDYVLLKWFDLLIDRKKEDFVRFHSLYRHPNSDEVSIESEDSYKQLSFNSISSTFSDLYDSEIERSLGGKYS